MTYDVEIDGAAARLYLEPGEGSQWTFRFDGEAGQTADCTHPEPGVWSILLDGLVYEARVERAGDGFIVMVGGRRFEVSVSDPRRWKGGPRAGAAAGKELVTAPMPGKVVRVLVRPGDTVEAGQGVAVVEAMKMQNEMKAHRAGAVISVEVEEGAAVSAGDALVVIG
jgi:biotin carboxyl carrier protein